VDTPTGKRDKKPDEERIEKKLYTILKGVFWLLNFVYTENEALLKRSPTGDSE